jgi:hypothetical protein
MWVIQFQKIAAILVVNDQAVGRMDWRWCKPLAWRWVHKPADMGIALSAAPGIARG